MPIPDRDIATATQSTKQVDNVTIDAVTTDGATGHGEFRYNITKWSEWFGVYTQFAQVKIAFDVRSVWTIGKGFDADPMTKAVLDHVTGWGTDTFNSILKNMIVTRRVGGDAFAEIIRDSKTDMILNIKPLDPSTMTIVTDPKGRLIRYEQRSKTSKAIKNYKPEQIFHLMNKRIADEVHGRSDIESIHPIVLAYNETFTDMRTLMHRHVKPMRHFKLKTDNQTKINAFIAKVDDMTNKGTDMYTPMDSVEHELLTVPSNATLNPLPWLQFLSDQFYQVVGIPKIIIGADAFSESASKIAYLVFQQSVEDEQLDIEEQVWNQLTLRIELAFPASIQNELISDTNKDGQDQQTGFQPNDTTAGVGA